MLFSEATTHGTLAWRGEEERRALIYRFAPATSGRTRYAENGGWPESWTEGMTPAQLATLQPPYHPRLDRESVAEDGVNVIRPRPRGVQGEIRRASLWFKVFLKRYRRIEGYFNRAFIHSFKRAYIYITTLGAVSSRGWYETHVSHAARRQCASTSASSTTYLHAPFHASASFAVGRRAGS